MDWKTKLTSRKLWIAIAAFVGMAIVAFGGNSTDSDKVTSLIMSGAVAISYIIGQGLVDASPNAAVAPVAPVDSVGGGAVAGE